MGLFRYDNPFIVLMVRIANMMIVSFFWVLCCLPVVTILPACAALYYTVNKVIFGSGNGVVKAFFKSFVAALKPGILLTVLTLVFGALIGFGLFTGSRIWDAGIFGAGYMAAGVLIAAVVLPMLIFIPPTLSRFDGGISVILRLSMYFSGRKLLRSLWYVALLAAAIWVTEFFPLLLLVVPALYTDLIRAGVEKTMTAYIRDAGLEDAEEEAAPDTAPPQELSPRELDALLTQEDRHED